MNTCHRYEELFSGYLEGDIARDQKNSVESHVRECSDCARKLGNINHVRQLLVGLPRAKVSSDFDSLLHARIRLENRRRKTLSGRVLALDQFRLPAYAMSFAIILIAFMLVISKIAQTQRGLPGKATKLAVIENNGTQSSDLVTIYPLDRASVNRVIGDEISRDGASSQVSAAEMDTVRIPSQSYRVTQAQARVYHTTY